MKAAPRPRPNPNPRGFTLVELITVLILTAILAVVAIPHLIGSGENAAQVFGDQLVSGLRLAQKSAQAHRRLVCVTLGARALTLRIAASNTPGSGASSCQNTLANAPDSDFATSDSSVSASGTPATLYFQPNGDITTDAAGAKLYSGALTVTGGSAQRTITIAGSTGYVE